MSDTNLDTTTIVGQSESARDAVGRDVLVARCEMLELGVSKQAGITPEIMAANKPGGADNRDQSATGWLTYLQWLTSQYAQGPKPIALTGARWDARAMDDMRAALAREPVYLTLESGRQVGVYPKGEHALHRLAVNQIALRWVTEHWTALLEKSDSDTSAALLATLDRAADAIAHLRAEFVAILTHPTAAVPWEETGAWDHPVPQWMRDEITPFDLLQLRAAYLEVNVHRVNAIAERMKQFGPTGDAMPLPAFLGVMADELKVQPEELGRRYSLGEVFALAFARYEATARAKARAESEQRT